MPRKGLPYCKTCRKRAWKAERGTGTYVLLRCKVCGDLQRSTSRAAFRLLRSNPTLEKIIEQANATLLQEASPERHRIELAASAGKIVATSITHETGYNQQRKQRTILAGEVAIPEAARAHRDNPGVEPLGDEYMLIEYVWSDGENHYPDFGYSGPYNEASLRETWERFEKRTREKGKGLAWY